MLRKRGQVTIFIILAILIVGTIALFLTLRGSLQGEEPISPEVAPIKNFVQKCLDDSLEEVVYRIGEGGGYYYPLEKLSTEDLGIAYYKIGNKNYMPSKERVEQEISKYVSEKVSNCTGDFETFPNYEIKQGKINSNTEILSDSVKINVDYPLTILKGDSSYRINEFEAEVFVPFGILYDATSEYITKELSVSPRGICVSCLLEITREYEIYADSFYAENDSVIFIFTDQYSYDTDYENALKYVFANKY